MRSLKYVLLTPVMLFALLLPAVAFASTQSEITSACATAAQNGGEMPSYCQTTGTTNDPLTGSNGTLTKVTNVVGFVAGVVAVVMIIIGGFRFVISRGDSAKAVTARQTIMYSVIGLIVIVFAREIVIFVLSRV